MKRRGRQAQLGPSLAAALGRLDRKNAGAGASAKVGAAWLKIVGPSVQGHTTGAYMRDGTLIVYVDSPAWATELSAMSERYRGAINEELGQELVSAIRFSVSRKVAEGRRIVTEQRETDDFYREDDVPSVSLTPTELSQVKDSVSAIPDPELREAVLRATVKDLEWKKGIAARSCREEPREAP
jgi:hypothetical protein